MSWQKAWQGLLALGNKCTLFYPYSQLGKKNLFFPTIIADAYIPRNTGKGAYKCCPVDLIVLIKILDTVQ